MKDDIQEKGGGDLKESGIEQSNTESSAEADTNTAAKQTSEGKGEMHSSGLISVWNIDRSCRASQWMMPGNKMGTSVEVSVSEAVAKR